jgi:choline monooxygenase
MTQDTIARTRTEPGEAPRTLDVGLYRDPATYAQERERVFAKTWHLLAHESAFVEAGSYVSASIAGYSVVAVRDETGAVRAYHNVCRHRAGPLVTEPAGTCQGALVCRYHGWRYALDGRLMSARDFGPAANFDARQYRLYPLRCEQWRGFVFINMDRDASPLSEFVAPLARRASAIPFGNLRLARHQTHDIACNWKTYVENYLEGYHVPDVHPPLHAAIDSARYEVQLEGSALFASAPPRNETPVAGVWAWLWPTTALNVYKHGVMVERMWPLDHARTRLDYLYFFPPETSEAEIEASMAASARTTAEDIFITEAVQRNLDAGIYREGRLSPKHEMGIAWFQREIRSALDL